jgi:hypothetical protein
MIAERLHLLRAGAHGLICAPCARHNAPARGAIDQHGKIDAPVDLQQLRHDLLTDVQNACGN